MTIRLRVVRGEPSFRPLFRVLYIGRKAGKFNGSARGSDAALPAGDCHAWKAAAAKTRSGRPTRNGPAYPPDRSKAGDPLVAPGGTGDRSPIDAVRFDATP